MDAECFRPQQVLGDVRKYNDMLQQQHEQQRLQQHSQQQLQQVTAAEGSMGSIDPSTVHPDVWAAACLLGDKGVEFLQYYRQLQDCREAAVQQMTLNQSLRTLTHHQQQLQFDVDTLDESAPGSSVGQLLSKPTVMDAIKQNHDARVMAAWESQQAVWWKQAAHLAAVAGKEPGQLTMSRAGADWRRKQELLSALEVAVPAAAAAVHKPNRRSPLDTNNRDGHDGDKGSIQDGGPVGAVACAGGNWMSSLRNANERLLQVGNIFSGLYLSIRNTSTVAAAGMTAIRKPAEDAFAAHIPGLDTSLGQDSIAMHTQCEEHASSSGTLNSTVGGSKKSSMLEKWECEPYLQEKLMVLQSHTPDAAQLAVRGWSIESALQSSPLTYKPVNLADVERRLAVADPALWQEYQAARQLAASTAAAEAASAEQQAKRAAARAGAAQLPHPGPHLDTSDTSLSMHFIIRTSTSSDGSCLGGSGPAGSALTPRPSASWAVINTSSQGCSAQQTSTPTSHMATFQLVSTGTAAVYYSWTSQGRQRLPLATAQDNSSSTASEQGSGAAAGGLKKAVALSPSSGGPLFAMPDLQGVILPGETKTFRFSFSASSPGVYHETWSCFTHPPVEPPADRRRRRGEPIVLQLKGVALLDGDSGGPALVAAQQLQQAVHDKTRDAQVRAALSRVLSRVQECVQQSAAQSWDSQRSSTPEEGYDHQVAAMWAAANPPGSCGCIVSGTALSADQTTDKSSADLCCHYYSVDAFTRLSDIYSATRTLLQPTPPVIEPPRKGATAAAAGTKGGAKSKEPPPEPAEPQLPDAWDCSIGGLRALLGRLQVAHRQEAAVLQQQLEVVLRGAAVPSRRHQLIEAACRHILLRLADAVEAVAQVAVPPSTEASSAGNKSHRSKAGDCSVTSRHGSSGTAADGTAVGAVHHARNSSVASSVAGGGPKGKVSSGGTAGDAALRSGLEGPASQQLHDEVWADCHQSFAGFDHTLAGFETAARAAVDAQTAALIASEQGQSSSQATDAGPCSRRAAGVASEEVAWQMFAAARKKQQLGLA